MIGVFDSGHGGLTVLRAIIDRLPERAFVYYGDHAHVPYGDRSSDEIISLTRAAVEILFGRGCRLVILACNTAAAVSLRTLQREWLPASHPQNRVLGVLVPTVEAITGVPWRGSIGLARTEPPRTIAVFATRRTVASGAYPEEIAKRAAEVRVIQWACAGLVDLIEADAPRAVLRAAVDGHVGGLLASLDGGRLDAVMLGCTHYALVADLFAAAVPRGIEIVSQPQLVAHSLAAYLERHPRLDSRSAAGALQLLTSGDATQASRFASRFFGHAAQFEPATVARA